MEEIKIFMFVKRLYEKSNYINKCEFEKWWLIFFFLIEVQNNSVIVNN